MTLNQIHFNPVFDVILPIILNLVAISCGMIVLWVYKRYSFLSLNVGKLIFRFVISDIIVNLMFLIAFFYFEQHLISRGKFDYPLPIAFIYTKGIFCKAMGFIRVAAIYFYYLITICISHNLYSQLKQINQQFNKRLKFY